MAGAVPEDMFNAGTYCANCFVFDWKQPDKDLLKRCSGCREVWYCDNMCQKEHWHNTHKNQCKYLQNKKVLRNAMHDESTCLMCKEETGVGRKEMSKKSNPTLPCTLSRANMKLMNVDEEFCEAELPYAALAEMTGRFHTKVEAIIVTFMRILVKMKMTKHLLWQPRSALLASNMYKILWEARIGHLKLALSFKKPGPLDGQLAFETVGSKRRHHGSDLGGIRLLCQSMGMIPVKDFERIGLLFESFDFIAAEELSSVYKPWGTLKVLMALLRTGQSSFEINAADCVGVAGFPEEFGGMRTTAAKFNEMRENVVSLLRGGLVSYSSLVVDGLCNGNSVQQCLVCREEIIIRNAATEGPESVTPPGNPVIVLGHLVTYTLCGSETCLVFDREDAFVAATKDLSDGYVTLCGEHVKEICDYCGRLNHKARGLRCASCLTKLYCGIECQVKDTYHLEVKCERGEKRKKKRSDASRKKEGREINERLESGNF